MSTPIPPASDRPNERPALGDAMQPTALDVPDSGQPDPTMAPHQRKGLKAAFKSTWRPLLLGFGIGAVLLGSGAGVAGYVWHQNDVEADRATAKKFAAEKSEAVKSARDEGVTQGTQDGYAQYKQEAEQQAAAAKAEAQKPYEDAKTNLQLAEPMCVTSKTDKRAITFTDHSVTLSGIGIASGPSDEAAGCVLGGIGMDSAVLDKMSQTRALDGRQEDSWGVWEVSWTYHPDQGLNVIAEIQDAPTN